MSLGLGYKLGGAKGAPETIPWGLEVGRRICTVERHVETRTLWGRRISSLRGESRKATRFSRKAEEEAPLRSLGGLGEGDRTGGDHQVPVNVRESRVRESLSNMRGEEAQRGE